MEHTKKMKEVLWKKKKKKKDQGKERRQYFFVIIATQRTFYSNKTKVGKIINWEWVSLHLTMG